MMEFFAEDVAAFSTNYVYEAYLEMSTYILEMQEMLEDERYILTEADEKGAVAKTKSLVSKKSLLGRLKEFIKKIIAMFQNNAHRLYRLYNKWLERAKQNLDNVNFQKLQVTMYSGYMEAEKKLDSAKSMVFRVDSYNFEKFQSASMDEFMKKPEISKYCDKTGSLANGCKNFFRYGKVSPNLSKVKMTGDTLKMAVAQAIDYCLNFQQTTKALKSLSANFELCMSTAENIVNKKAANEAKQEPVKSATGTQESVCLSLLEGYVIDFESCGLYDNIDISSDIIVEAEEKANTAPQVETGDTKNPADGGKAGEGNQKEKTNMETINDMSGTDAKTLMFLCRYLQTVYSSALTVAEERYNLYIKICKYVLKNTKFKYDDGLETGDLVDKDKAEKAQKESNTVRGKVTNAVKSTAKGAAANIKSKFTKK